MITYKLTLVIDKIPYFSLLQGMRLEICLDKGTISLMDDTAAYLTLSVAEGENMDAKEIWQILSDTNQQQYVYSFGSNSNVAALTNRLLDAGMPQDFFKEFPNMFNYLRLAF